MINKLLPYILLIGVFLIRESKSKCTEPRIRKSWTTLTAAEQSLYVNAVWQLKKNGIYDQFVSVHASNYNYYTAHSTDAFFPWHRWYIWLFEEALRSVGTEYECLTLPYWDWEKDAGNENESPVFGSYFGSYEGLDDNSCVTDGYFSEYNGWTISVGGCLTRAFDSTYSFVGEAQIMSDILTSPSYSAYNGNSVAANGYRSIIAASPHSSVHTYIDETMNTQNSPDDPLFFLHHTNVDRLWAIWQDCHDYDTVASCTTNYCYPTSLLDEAFPYDDENGNPVSFFFSPLSDSPRAVSFISIQNNPIATFMNYSYDQNDDLVTLINQNYPGHCNWNWWRSDSSDNSVSSGSSDSSNEPSDSSDSSDSSEENHWGNSRGGNRYRGEEVGFWGRWKRTISNKNFPKNLPAINETDYETAGEGRKKIHKKGNFYNDRLQKEWVHLVSDLPAMKHKKKIELLALSECVHTGSKKHASEEWIKMHHMEHLHHLFDSICPPKGCCSENLYLHPSLLCSDESIAKSFCNTTTCTWQYACEQEKHLAVSQATQETTETTSEDGSRYHTIELFGGFCLGIIVTFFLVLLIVKLARFRRIQKEEIV